LAFTGFTIRYFQFFLSLSSALAQKIDRFVGLICEKNQQQITDDGITDCPNFNTELFMVTEEEVSLLEFVTQLSIFFLGRRRPRGGR
jgi:hypothetical protein